MIPAESAHDTIGALGDVGLLQFKDLNADKSAFQRTYANQVRVRCCEARGISRVWVASICARARTPAGGRHMLGTHAHPIDPHTGQALR